MNHGFLLIPVNKNSKRGLKLSAWPSLLGRLAVIGLERLASMKAYMRTCIFVFMRGGSLRIHASRGDLQPSRILIGPLNSRNTTSMKHRLRINVETSGYMFVIWGLEQKDKLLALKTLKPLKYVVCHAAYAPYIGVG